MTALAGRVAVVTGASRGIGEAIALALAASGARLCLVGRDEDTLLRVAQGAHRAHDTQVPHRCFRADLADDADVERLADSLRRDLQTVDVLVHAAGILHPARFENASAAQFDAQYRTNVRAPFVLTQRLLAPLKVARGQVVFVNSSAGLSARADHGQYAATKHALKAVADSLREEVNPAGVRVLSVFLGRTATRMQAELHAIEGKPYEPVALIQPEDVAALTLQVLLMPRNVEVTDISLRPMRKPPA
ncbi:SDR family NAD(P)-dependent oxidoreductase [Ramlibacter rhizophilus]|uniref:SDR family NAD(P)-dependent oxidoreductase n=1 Tax=Ramlibacter rhizophilus TaxID=1781167 RepID=A0A4Z0BDJ6_9BURK|nr:SDR family NAD(P)-dependent oxidoreductase [Ramlibacter rhizophilus]TFY96870.1 SDR family NAD(P)-dependent oxidoreductase [Ramlibacter rhizophilus]